MEVNLNNYTSSAVRTDGGGMTQVDSVKYSYTWVINHITSYWKGMPADKEIWPVSPIFVINGNESWKWKIAAKFYEDDGHDMMDVALWNVNKTKVFTKWKISILDASGQDFHVVEGDLQDSNWMMSFIQPSGLLKKREEVIRNDTLTIRCDMIIFGKTTTISSNPVLPEASNVISCLSEDFGNLLKSETFSDLTLDVAGREFKVHKCILSSRSPVFASMLQHKMKESESSRVEVQDINPEVMDQLLQFIYTGKADKIEDMAMDLLFASDKYGLEGLKDICTGIIVTTLSVENAAEILVVADRHSVAQLKNHVVNFIKLRGKDVMETEGWKTFAVEHPKLVAELLNDYMKGK